MTRLKTFLVCVVCLVGGFCAGRLDWNFNKNRDQNRAAVQSVLNAARALQQRTGTIRGSVGLQNFAAAMNQISARNCPADFYLAWSGWQEAYALYADKAEHNGNMAALSVGLAIATEDPLPLAGLKQTPPDLQSLYTARDKVRDVALKYGAR